MANNYTQGATLVPAANVLQPQKIMKAWEVLCAAFERAEERGINFPYEVPGDGSDYGSSGLVIELSSCGDLYIGSDEESMNGDLFINFIGTCIKAGWIKGSVGISLAYFCDKLRADAFGGYHLRVLTDGTGISIGTGTLEMMSGEDLRKILSISKY
jgi:hypothetical protein